MKYDILLDMLFDLLGKHKATAQYFAQKYGVSERTAYRYVNVLSSSVPIEVKQGRGGGIYISDAYKLPVGFLTREEYAAANEALEAMYSQLPEERFLTVRKKLAAQSKEEEKQLFFSGDSNFVMIDSGSWGDSKPFSEKIRLFENAAKSLSVVEIDYFSRGGERTIRKIEPHILIYKQSVWYVYAFCRVKKEFRLFRIGRVYSAFLTGETFVRREVKRENIPLHYWKTAESADVKLEVREEAFADVQDWLGCEN
ncbi:MAG: helix-turn-helix transcriptional regulator, partial [Candidatus Scatosoma sp.]